MDSLVQILKAAFNQQAKECLADKEAEMLLCLKRHLLTAKKQGKEMDL